LADVFERNGIKQTMFEKLEISQNNGAFLLRQKSNSGPNWAPNTFKKQTKSFKILLYRNKFSKMQLAVNYDALLF